MIRALFIATLLFATAAFTAAAQAETIQAVQTVVGIGVSVDTTADGHLMIQALIPGAPAEKSGLVMVGDEIMGVQATPADAFVRVQGSKIEDVTGLIRGSEGVAVGLELQRPGVAGEITVSIVRAKFEVDVQE